MSALRLMPFAVVGAALLAACTGDVGSGYTSSGTTLGSTATSIMAGGGLRDTDDLAEALRDRGLDVATATGQASSSEPIFANATSTILSVNGQTIQVYEFEDATDAMNATAMIAADGNTIDGIPVTWVGSPHFYRNESVVVLYLGNNPAIMDPLEEVMGPVFAGVGVNAPTGTGSTVNY